MYITSTAYPRLTALLAALNLLQAETSCVYQSKESTLFHRLKKRKPFPYHVNVCVDC